MRIMKIFFMLSCCLGLTLSGAEDRIWVDATINGQRVRLAFDTGASDSALLRSTAQRLKLKISEPPPDFRPAPGQVAAGYTEPCDFEFGTLKTRGEFRVVEFPPGLSTELEGLLGWSRFKNKVLSIDALSLRVNIRDSGTERADGWPKFKLRSDEEVLAFELEGQESAPRIVYVDTGSDKGISLNPSLWKKWAAIQTNQPVTMTAYFTPGVGLVVKQERWATEIAIGSLVLKEVPVLEEAPRETQLLKSNHAARLGLFALRRMDLIADGPNGIVYVRPRGGPTPAYAHNRLGAVFTPRDMQSDPLLAHVAPRTPAYFAGIRDDDVLLKIDDLDVTKWRTDSRFAKAGYWERPAGTEYRLTLKRGQREFQVTVVLKDILGYGLNKTLE